MDNERNFKITLGETSYDLALKNDADYFVLKRIFLSILEGNLRLYDYLI